MTSVKPNPDQAAEYIQLKSFRDAAKRRLEDASKVDNPTEWQDAKHNFDVAQLHYGTILAKMMGM